MRFIICLVLMLVSFSFECLFTSAAITSPEKLTIYSLKPEASSVKFKIKYNLGEHEGLALEAKGYIQIQEHAFKVIHSEVSLPITKMTTSNDKRDCHLRESLGLDYSKSSFPKDHVCNDSQKLPEAGPNSIAFSEIRFKGLSLELNSKMASGTLEIHGVKKEVQIPITISRPDAATVRIKSDFEVKLSDYGITVKNFLFVSVHDLAQVEMDLKFITLVP